MSVMNLMTVPSNIDVTWMLTAKMKIQIRFLMGTHALVKMDLKGMERHAHQVCTIHNSKLKFYSEIQISIIVGFNLFTECLSILHWDKVFDNASKIFLKFLLDLLLLLQKNQQQHHHHVSKQKQGL